MSVKVMDNTSAITAKIKLNASIALRAIADDIVKTSNPKTPKKTGRLRADVLKQVLGLKGKVIWGKNYAVYQESKRFRNYTTGGTGPHFAADAVKAVVSRSGAYFTRGKL